MELRFTLSLQFDRPISAEKAQAMQDFLAMLLEREFAPIIEQCGDELCDYDIEPIATS